MWICLYQKALFKQNCSLSIHFYKNDAIRALFTKSNQSKMKSNRESNSNQPIVCIHQARSRLIRNQTKIKSTDFSLKFDALLLVNQTRIKQLTAMR